MPLRSCLVGPPPIIETRGEGVREFRHKKDRGV